MPSSAPEANSPQGQQPRRPCSALVTHLLALLLALLLTACIGVYSPEQLEPSLPRNPSPLIAEVLMRLQADYYALDQVVPLELLQASVRQANEAKLSLQLELKGSRVRLTAEEGAVRTEHPRPETLEALNVILQNTVLQLQRAGGATQVLEFELARGLTEPLDPFTVVMPSEEFQEFRSSVTGEYAGIGILVSDREEQLKVVEVFPGSPAERAGLRSGDVIVSVEGRLVEVAQFEQALEALRGEPGARVTLEVLRGDDPEPRSFELVREFVHADSTEVSTLESAAGTVALVHLETFQQGLVPELVRKLGALEDVSGLILDLRNNPGGLLEAAVELSDLFLPGGRLIVEARTTISSQDHRSRDLFLQERWNEVPVLVLVNPQSASASEILAAALKYHRRALVLGQKTYGKGTIQSAWEAKSGEGIKLTIGEYRLPDGTSLHQRGLEPDELVEETLSKTSPPPLDEQPSIQRSLQLLAEYAATSQGWAEFLESR